MVAVNDICSSAVPYLKQFPLDTAFASRLIYLLESATGIPFHDISEGNVRIREDLEITDSFIAAMHGIRPNGFELIFGSPPTEKEKLTCLPSISLESFVNTNELDNLASIFSETLTGDVIQVGSMLGTKLDSTNPAEGAALISCLLNSGFAYVVGEGKVLALLNYRRSVLELSDSTFIGDFDCFSLDSSSSSAVAFKAAGKLPIPLAKRILQLPRIFRTKLTDPNKKLQLRLTTNLSLSLEKLRAHHGSDCWVGPELEAVWRLMSQTSPPQLYCFELWWGDDLIAGDFAHLTANGRSVYVATRFFSRDNPQHKQIMPGFVLALAACKILQECGVFLWDLGGIDGCPLMQYKLSLAGEPLERPVALEKFRRAKKAGVVIRKGDRCNGDGSEQVTAAREGQESARSVNNVSSFTSLSQLRTGMILLENITFDDLVIK